MADPPYGTTANKWDSTINLEQMWAHLKRVVKPTGAIVLMAQTPFDKVLGVSNLKMLRYEWIWKKTCPSGHFNAKRAPLKEHENLLVFYRKAPTYNPQMVDGPVKKARRVLSTSSKNYCGRNKAYTEAGGSKRYPRDILTFAKVAPSQSTHPTQKPVALMEYMISTYTNPGETVLDFSMGSGSTGVACKKLDRKFIGIEMYSDIFRTAQERISAASA